MSTHSQQQVTLDLGRTEAGASCPLGEQDLPDLANTYSSQQHYEISRLGYHWGMVKEDPSLQGSPAREPCHTLASIKAEACSLTTPELEELGQPESSLKQELEEQYAPALQLHAAVYLAGCNYAAIEAQHR